jgi:hypothetical protein
LNREKINFVLLKVVPHVKNWWENFGEQKEMKEPSLFTVTVTWESFKDAIKEQYYPTRVVYKMDHTTKVVARKNLCGACPNNKSSMI